MNDVRESQRMYLLERERAEITVEVVVPKERPVCRYCQGWLDYDERVRRHYCRLTQEPLVDPDGDIGFRCPLRGEVENA